MHGIMKNIAQLCKRKKSQTWGDDGWKSELSDSTFSGGQADPWRSSSSQRLSYASSLTVAKLSIPVYSTGELLRRLLSPTQLLRPTSHSLAALGVYQEGLATNKIDDNDVQAHLYEYTTQMSITADLKFQSMEKGITPVQTVFLLKEKKWVTSRRACRAAC